MKVFVLVNPSAGKSGALRVAVKVLQLLADRGVSHELAVSTSAEDLTAKARLAAQSDADRVLVVGGDGTWHFALNGLAETGKPSALIPCGRGNDFRVVLGLPGHLPAALDTALAGTVKPLDLVWTGRRYYIGVAGVGFDSEVTECANTGIPFLAGRLAYSAAVFYKLFSFKPKQLRIEHENGRFEGRVMFAVFGNSTSYGGGMKIAPQADMTDGLMDVLVIRQIGIPMLLKTMPKVFSGTHIPHPDILTFRAAKVEIISPDKMDLYGDGEYIQPVPVTLEVRPGALMVVAP